MARKSADRLRAYREKRDFRRTREPSGGGRDESPGGPIFVIQKHAASTLHYDFRIEAEGALKSWAVPKGPSTDPRVKRLALSTEDHPLEYADFEGVIAEGEYGGGTVLVWDTGRYRNLSEHGGDSIPLARALERGRAAFWLDGKKLQGGYALIRTGRGDDARWLLVKMKDEHADARRNPVSTEPESVISGRTIEQIAAEESGDT